MVIGGLPGSCLKVLEAVNFSKEGICQQEILDRTKLSKRSVKYALKNLKSEGLVSEEAVLSDVRKKKYFGGDKSER